MLVDLPKHLVRMTARSERPHQCSLETLNTVFSTAEFGSPGTVGEDHHRGASSALRDVRRQ